MFYTRKVTLAVTLAAVIGLAACSGGGSSTAAGGCWYVNPNGTDSGSLAFHLPQCSGTEASLQRTVMVDPLGMKSGSEPANAKEICQVKVGGNDPTAWVGVWADASISDATGGAQELCQEAADAGSGIRWSNFH